MAIFNKITNVTTNTDIVDVKVDQILCDLFNGNETSSEIIAAPRPSHFLFDFPVADAPFIGDGELVGLKANFRVSALRQPDNFATPMANIFKIKETGLLTAAASAVDDDDVVTLAGNVNQENITFEEGFSPVTDDGRDIFEEKGLRSSYLSAANKRTFMEWEYAYDNQRTIGKCSDRSKFKDRYSELVAGGQFSGRRVVYVSSRSIGGRLEEYTPVKGKEWYDPWEPVWLASDVDVQTHEAGGSSATRVEADSDIKEMRPKGLHVINSFSSPDVIDSNNATVCEARVEIDKKIKRTGSSSLRLHTFWDIDGTGGAAEPMGQTADYDMDNSFISEKGSDRSKEQVSWACLAVDQSVIPNPVNMDYFGANGSSKMGASIEIDFAIDEMTRTWKDKAQYDSGIVPGQRYHRFKRTFTIVLSENPPDSDQDLTSFLTRELTTQSPATGVIISRLNASSQFGAEDYIITPFKGMNSDEVSGDYPTGATGYDANDDYVRSVSNDGAIGMKYFAGAGGSGDQIDGTSTPKPSGFGPDTNNLTGKAGFINRGPFGTIYNSLKQGVFNRLSFIFRPEGVVPKTSASGQGPGEMYGEGGGGRAGCYVRLEQIADSLPINNQTPFTDGTGDTEYDDNDVEGTDIAYTIKGGVNNGDEFLNSFDSMPRFISLWVNNWPVNASGTNSNDISYPANRPSTVTVNVDKVCFKNFEMGAANATASLQNTATSNIRMASTRGLSYKGQTDFDLQSWAFGFDSDSDIEGATRYLYFNNFSTLETNKSKPIKMFTTAGGAEGSHKQTGLNVGYTRLEKLGYQGSRATLSPSTKNTGGTTVDGYGLSLIDECVVQNYSRIQTRADSSDDLNGKYFTITDHDGNNYHVWFDVDNSGTSEPSVSSSTGIEVTGVTTNMRAANVAAQVVSTLNAYKVGGEQIWHANNKYPDVTTAGTAFVYVLFVQTGTTAPTLGAGTSGFASMVSYANNSGTIENHLVDGFTNKGYVRFNFSDANFSKRECIYASTRVSSIVSAGEGKIRISNPDIFKGHLNDEYIIFVHGMEHTDRTVTITSVAAAGSGASNTTKGSVITASAAHGLLPGDQVKFSGGDLPSELSATTTYTVATAPTTTTFTVHEKKDVSYDNRRVNISAQTDDFTCTVLGGDYQKTVKVLEGPDSDNVVTLDANLESYKESYWNTATKGRTFISPKKYWVYFVFENTANDDTKLSSRSYGTVHSLSSALSTLGTTFNEYTYTEDATNKWNLSPGGDNSFVVLDDYGFGEFDESVSKGGMVSKENLKLNTFVEFDCSGIVKDKDVDVGKNVTLMMSPESPNLDYSFTVDTNDNSTAANRPYFVTEFEDELPTVEDFKIAPNKEDAFNVDISWACSDNDLWYGFIIVSEESIDNQYKGSIIHLPFNESGTHNAEAGTIVDQVGGNTVTAGGLSPTNKKPLIHLEGLSGNALNFDGSNDLVAVGATNNSDDVLSSVSDEFSVVAHINHDGGTVDGNFEYIISKEGFDLYVDNNKKVKAVLHSAAAEGVTLTSSSSVVGGEAMNIIVTLDSFLTNGNCKLFINGRLEDVSGDILASHSGSSLTQTGWVLGTDLYTDDGAMFIGREHDDSGGTFDGRIEELVFYNTVIYPVQPKTGLFTLTKPLEELKSGSNASAKPYAIKLFVKDYHNVRGKSVTEVATTAQEFLTKPSFRIDGS